MSPPRSARRDTAPTTPAAPPSERYARDRVEPPRVRTVDADAGRPEPRPRRRLRGRWRSKLIVGPHSERASRSRPATRSWSRADRGATMVSRASRSRARFFAARSTSTCRGEGSFQGEATARKKGDHRRARRGQDPLWQAPGPGGWRDERRRGRAQRAGAAGTLGQDSRARRGARPT